MFARLKGIVDEIGADHAVIDVHGVGYLVQASRRTLGALGGTGAAATLHVETHVRENDIHLYGFVDRAERDWFRLLVTVQGVGAKVALAVLSVLDPSALAAAIAAQDARAPGERELPGCFEHLEQSQGAASLRGPSPSKACIPIGRIPVRGPFPSEFHSGAAVRMAAQFPTPCVLTPVRSRRSSSGVHLLGGRGTLPLLFAGRAAAAGRRGSRRSSRRGARRCARVHTVAPPPYVPSVPAAPAACRGAHRRGGFGADQLLAARLLRPAHHLRRGRLPRLRMTT